MTTKKIYELPVEVTNWKFDGATEIQFNWEYDDGSSDLLNLYEKGKQQQWDTSTRIDWTQELDPENPMGMADESIPIYGSDIWNKMTEKERNWLRFNLQCHSICQFMHGEQGALIATAKIVNTVPDMNAKFYAATQVMDEARHVESYKRLIHEKFKAAYPITESLKNLLEQTLTDRRWDMTYLGMQVLIEGLALAAFQRIRDQAKNNLAASVNAYVMQDEARHVTFGRMALREYYPHLSDAERAERSPSRRCTSCATASTRARSGCVRACRSTSSWSTRTTRAPCRRSARACSPASCRSSRRSACSDPRCRRHWATWA
jgi:hypothetical protein